MIGGGSYCVDNTNQEGRPWDTPLIASNEVSASCSDWSSSALMSSTCFRGYSSSVSFVTYRFLSSLFCLRARWPLFHPPSNISSVKGGNSSNMLVVLCCLSIPDRSLNPVDSSCGVVGPSSELTIASQLRSLCRGSFSSCIGLLLPAIVTTSASSTGLEQWRVPSIFAPTAFVNEGHLFRVTLRLGVSWQQLLVLQRLFPNNHSYVCHRI